MTWTPPARSCVVCSCPLMLLRGERRRHCARCGGGVRAPKATVPCSSEGCAGLVDPSRSVTGVCVACRAKSSALRSAFERRRDPEACGSCGGKLGVHNATGHCAACVNTAGTCRVDGCQARVAAFSATQLCKNHNRSEVRRHYGVDRGKGRAR